MQSSTELHEAHSAEQKELDDQLNKLYTNQGDKIEHLNSKLIECNAKGFDLDVKIAEIKRLQQEKGSVDDDLEAKIAQKRRDERE